MLGKVGGQEKKETTEDDMVGRHHLLNGHEFEQALGDGDRQGSLVCCSLSGHKEWDTTEQLHNNGIIIYITRLYNCYKFHNNTNLICKASVYN